MPNLLEVSWCVMEVRVRGESPTPTHCTLRLCTCPVILGAGKYSSSGIIIM